MIFVNSLGQSYPDSSITKNTIRISDRIMGIKKKVSFNKDLIHEVDQLIMDTGCYQAVELLLRFGLLAYAEYEQWRMGKIPYLSDILSTQKETIIPLLDEAGLYVKSLKMTPEPVIMQQWEQNEIHDHLKFCPDNSIFTEYLTRQYFRKNDDDQMDLFFDNQSLVIIRELKRALISRNIRIASQKFQALYDIEPEHEIVMPAKKLLDALINALEEEQVTDPVDEMHYLLSELSPLAKKALAGQERDYMSLFWRRLARYIDDSLYNEFSTKEQAGIHTSFCYQQIPDWQAVINSIEQMPNGMQQPELLARYAIALRKSGQREQYIQAICQYFWQFSNEDYDASVLLKFIAEDSGLKNSWHDFQDLELDEQWGRQHFPCWLLIQTPGISHHIISGKQTPEEFKILHKLILTEIKENRQSITLRKQLKESHAGMLEYYLKLK